MIFFRCLFFLILILGCGSKGEPPPSKMSKKESTPQKPLILFVGDSLTAGFGVDVKDCFVSLLQKDFEKMKIDLQTRNAGISGETSSGTLERIDWLVASKPKFIFLCIGSNDGLRGISVDLYRNNLEQIILKIQKANIKLILAGIKLPINYGAEYIHDMESVPIDLAEKYSLLNYPYLIEGVAADPKLNQADFIHPNEKGHRIIFERLNKFLKMSQLY